MFEHAASHQHLPDGGLLRLDFECERYVASWYRCDRSLRAVEWGSLEAMQAKVAVWAAVATKAFKDAA
jgi:uncharacterized membrane-anchored protein